MIPSRGVTWFQLLIAMIVLTIIAAIAWPAYQNRLVREQRAEATRALLKILTAQEAHFAAHNRYAGANQLTTAPPAGLGVAAISQRGAYDLALVNVDSDGAAFRAVARPRPARGARSDPRCREFSIDHNGLRLAKDSDGVERSADCWR